jgi:hypothetical protein
MSAVIVTPDLVGPIKNGGIGTFATNFAFLLARHSCDVSIIFTNPVEVQQDRWLSMYRQQHIQVDMISDGQKDSFNSASFDFVLHSQDIAERIPQETDVVYFKPMVLSPHDEDGLRFPRKHPLSRYYTVHQVGCGREWANSQTQK